MFAPKGVSKDIVARLSPELVRIHSLPDVKERFFTLGAEAATSTPAQFTDFIKSEAARFSKILKEAEAKAD